MDLQLYHDILYVFNDKTKQVQWHIAEIPKAGENTFGIVKSGRTVKIEDGIPEVSDEVVQLEADGTISKLVGKSLPKKTILIRGFPTIADFPHNADVGALYFDIDKGILYQCVEKTPGVKIFTPINKVADRAEKDLEGNVINLHYLSKASADEKFVAKDELVTLLNNLSVSKADLADRAVADKAGNDIEDTYLRKDEQLEIDNDYIVQNNNHKITVNQSEVATLDEELKLKDKLLKTSNQEVRGVVKTGEGLSISEDGTLSIDLEKLLGLIREQIISQDRRKNFTYNQITIKSDLKDYLAKKEVKNWLHPLCMRVTALEEKDEEIQKLKQEITELNRKLEILSRIVSGHGF